MSPIVLMLLIAVAAFVWWLFNIIFLRVVLSIAAFVFDHAFWIIGIAAIVVVAVIIL